MSLNRHAAVLFTRFNNPDAEDADNSGVISGEIVAIVIATPCVFHGCCLLISTSVDFAYIYVRILKTVPDKCEMNM